MSSAPTATTLEDVLHDLLDLLSFAHLSAEEVLAIDLPRRDVPGVRPHWEVYLQPEALRRLEADGGEPAAVDASGTGGHERLLLCRNGIKFRAFAVRS